MRSYRQHGVLVLAILMVTLQASSRARAAQEFTMLMYCPSFYGCWVAWFYTEQVEVVASYGQLNLFDGGYWGFASCPDCMRAIEEPPPHPEPVDGGGGPVCGDARDTIIEEYSTHGVGLSPACSDFDSGPWILVLPGESHDGWAIDRGLAHWKAQVQEYAGLGTLRHTSAYRCPHVNAGIPGAATNSRHMYGDALDLTPAMEYWSPPTVERFTQLRNAALQTNPSYITNWDTYSDRHLHVDWR